MFRASPCPSSGAQEYYTVVAACGILCCGFSSSWSGVQLRLLLGRGNMSYFWPLRSSLQPIQCKTDKLCVGTIHTF